MKVFTGLAGWVCMSALLSGLQTGEASDSISRCKLSFSSSSSSESVIVAAEAVADASAYVCGGSVAAASAKAVAEATATAAARAVAYASADCYSTGKASFKVNGRSLAQAYAYAYAEAFASGMVDAAVCDKCKVSAKFVADSWTEVFLSAAAEAEIELSGSGDAAANAEIYVEAVAEAVVTAYAAVLVDARAAFDKGCDGSIIGVVITGDPEDPKDGALCSITVSGNDESIAVDAAAEVAKEISELYCGDNFRVDLVSKKYAKAIAKAIAEVTLDCKIIGNGFACALGEADVKVVAEATATALARLIVEANLLDTTCGCEVSVDAILDATKTIVSKAAASAWAGVCAVESFHVQDLEVAIEAKIAVAFAGIWAKIRDDGCTVDVDIVAGVKTCKSCVAADERCYYGRFTDVKGCCDPKYKCTRRSSISGYCIEPSAKPHWWKGGHPECTPDH